MTGDAAKGVSTVAGRVGRDGSWLEVVEEMKSEGKVRHFGVSTTTSSTRAPRTSYCLYARSAASALIVRGQGALTGNVTPETTFDEGDFRNEYFKGDRKHEVRECVRAIVSELGIPEEKLPEVALRYVLSHPAVSTVILGMRSVRNVERNIAVADGAGMPADQIQKLKAHRWARNFYPAPSGA